MTLKIRSPVTSANLLSIVAIIVSCFSFYFAKQANDKQLQLAKNSFLATARPWINVPNIPTVTSAIPKPDGITLALAITYKTTGQSPAGNGEVAAFILQTLNGLSAADFVKHTTDERPDCPQETRPDEWVRFNTLSDAVQEVSATGRSVSMDKAPYVLICARYDWALDRSQRGRVIILYQLSGTSKKARLSLLASYAG